MVSKVVKIGYFSLPEKIKIESPQTFLFLDKDGRIKIGDISGREAPLHQFMRSLTRGDITLTKEGEKFVKRVQF